MEKRVNLVESFLHLSELKIRYSSIIIIGSNWQDAVAYLSSKQGGDGTCSRYKSQASVK